MDIRLIGVIKDRTKNLIGTRIIDIDTGEIKDVPSSGVITVLKSGKAKIDGIEVKDDKLIGSNGALDRYPVIINNKIIGESPLVIIKQYIENGETVGYKVSDWKGNLKKASVASVINYAKQFGISNGAVKNVGGKEFISSISGEYKKEEVRKQAVQRVAQSKVDDREDIEKTIWNIEKFKEYMNKNNYKYKFISIGEGTNNEIIFECPEAKILKYPIGIDTADCNILSDNSTVETLILSPSVKQLGCKIYNVAGKLKRIVLQEGINEFNAVGIQIGSMGAPLAELVLPKSLKSIKRGISGFALIDRLDLSHTSLKEVDNCFIRLGGVKELKLPDTLKSMNTSFIKLIQLRNLKLPRNIRSITGSLNELKTLKQIEIPESIEEIAGSLCESGIEELDLSKCIKLKKIGDTSFNNCKNLKKVILPPNLEEIGSRCFNDSAIEELDLSKCTRLRSIGEYSFVDCDKLKKIEWNTELVSIGNNSFRGSSIDVLDLSTCEKMTEIGWEIFGGCDSIRVLKLPKYTAKLEKYCFSKLGIEELDISMCTGITEIPEYGFSKNMKLKKVMLPETIEKIGEKAFSGCNNVAYIGNSDNIKDMGGYAFEYCNMQEYTITKRIEKFGDRCFREGIKLKFANDVTEIKEGTFKGYHYENVEVPTSVTKIGNNAFRDSCITSIIIPSGVEEIGDRAFEMASELKTVVIEEGVKTLGRRCFNSCRKLDNLVIPRSVEKIGESVFDLMGHHEKFGATVYVYEGTEGHRYCEKENVYYEIIESISDIKNGDTKRIIPQAKLAKMKLLLSNKIPQSILEEPYINYADNLYALYNQIENNTYKTELKLNTENMVKIPLAEVPVIRDIVKDEKINASENSMAHRFINLSNYITGVMENRQVDKGKFNRIIDKREMEHKVLYNDSNGIIMNILDRSLIFTIIVIGDNIEFIGLSDNTEDTPALLQESYCFRTKTKLGSIAPLMEVGDRISGDWDDWNINRIKGSPVPIEISNSSRKSLQEHLAMIGLHALSRDCSIIDFMCKDTGTILTVKASINERRKNTNIVHSLRYIKVIGVGNVANISESVRNRIRSHIRDNRICSIMYVQGEE